MDEGPFILVAEDSENDGVILRTALYRTSPPRGERWPMAPAALACRIIPSRKKIIIGRNLKNEKEDQITVGR